jgi:hypothetical protein
MRWLLGVFGLVAGGCATAPPKTAAHAPSPYLFVFAGDRDEKDDDFFAVIDVRRGSRTAGKVIATLPIGMKASMPHHMEYWTPGRGELLFANAHHHEASFLLDTADPLRPRIVRTLQPPKPLRFGHDFARLANGNLLAGFLRSEGPSPATGDSLVPGGHGGLAEYTREGELLRVASAADAKLKQPVRTYAMVPMLGIDRIVTTSAPMIEDYSADVVQVWRYSDLKLLHTLEMPAGRKADGAPLPGAGRYPFGPRLMPDGSILMNAYGCGFFRLTGIASDQPRLDNVYTIQVPEPPRAGAVRGACSVPTVVGRHWIMPVGRIQSVVVLDVSNPASPREVSRVVTPADFKPHWSAKDPLSDRVVIGAELGGEQGMFVMRFDERTGQLRFDESLVPASGKVGYIDLESQSWPHGASGAAWAHAALFLPGAD